MLKAQLFAAALAGFATSTISSAAPKEPDASPPVTRAASPGRFTVPGTGYEVALRLTGTKPASQPPSPRLVRALGIWLAENFALPLIASQPAVKLVSPVKITTLRYTGLLSDKPEDVADVPAGQREVVATYDPLTRTIYLPEGWTGTTPAELSVLVHEMVHDLQNVARTRFACVEASEELAYSAQEKWLSLFGHSLMKDFEIDPMTLLVSTRCGMR